MPCYSPLRAYKGALNPITKKRTISFSPSQAYADLPIDLPCGQCIGCRLERSRQWAIRCMHEASLHENNCFITLTYNNKHLPENGTLVKKDFQDFMKRLRKKNPNTKIRYFHCGEYGDQKGRPHYHACLFGFDFKDKKHFRTSDTGHEIYRSKQLEQTWTYGYSEIGSVTFESAAYVARYITKKHLGKGSVDYYNEIDYNTGEIIKEWQPEYVTMSRRDGIGKKWFELYGKEKYINDKIIINGKECKLPKYYDKQFEILDPDAFQAIKNKRIAASKNNLDNTPDRLQVKETLQQIKANQLIRSFEQDPESEQRNEQRQEI